MIINQTASGGKSEGTNAYLVKQLSIGDGSNTSIECRNSSSTTYPFYDSLTINDYGELEPVGTPAQYTGREINKMSTSQKNALIGKYYHYVSGRFVYEYKVLSLSDKSDDDGSYVNIRVVMQDVQEATVKHGVNDDASIYASQTKCPDGYWRING